MDQHLPQLERGAVNLIANFWRKEEEGQLSPRLKLLSLLRSNMLWQVRIMLIQEVHPPT